MRNNSSSHDIFFKFDSNVLNKCKKMLRQDLLRATVVDFVPEQEPSKCNKCKQYLKNCFPIFIILLIVILIIGGLTSLTIYNIQNEDGSLVE